MYKMRYTNKIGSHRGRYRLVKLSRFGGYKTWRGRKYW